MLAKQKGETITLQTVDLERDKHGGWKQKEMIMYYQTSISILSQV